jgi:HD-GYP domain-containing protein (c-di-GMP phosphodiesterase class II)
MSAGAAATAAPADSSRARGVIMAIVDRENLTAAAEEVIRLIEVARKRIQIYPSHHPAVRESVMRLLRAVEDILQGRPHVSFNIAHGEIFLDEIPLANATLRHTEFVELSAAKAMSTLTFKAGVTDEEMTKLVQLLNERGPVQTAENEPSFQERLAEKGVERIQAGMLVSSSEVNLLEEGITPAQQEAMSSRDRALELVWETYHDLLAGKAIDYENLGLAVKGIVRALLDDREVYRHLVDIKDYHNYTFNHVVNVAVLALLFGADLGLNADQLNSLGVAAFLHDAGKLGVPVELLKKPGKLTDEEWAVVQRHPVEGALTLLEQCGHENIGVTVALEHHARYDLSGYPKMTRGRELHLFSRIVSLSDVYDALTSDRSYRRGMMPDQAASIILSGSGKDFDPALAKLFVQSVGVYPRDCVVLLTNGETAIVQETNPDDPARPKVRLARGDNEIIDLHGTDIGISKCIDTAATLPSSEHPAKHVRTSQASHEAVIHPFVTSSEEADLR